MIPLTGPTGRAHRRGRRLVVVLALVTAAVLVLDLASPGTLAPVRRAAATAFAPVQSALAGLGEDGTAELLRERDALAARVAALEEQVRHGEEVGRLRASASWARHPLLPARVVGFAPAGAPGGGGTVTVDVGSEDGVREDLTVVSKAGLVGRVVRVAPSSSDVLLLGEPGVVVAVRVGSGGLLGSVGAEPPAGLAPRDPGRLSLTVLGEAPVRVGDQVVTLGSPDGTPYAAGVPLGTVTEVDPGSGRLESTAVVSPHLDPATLDLVAVVLAEPR